MKVAPDDGEQGGSAIPKVAKTCWFWIRMFPPIKWTLTFFKWLFLSRTEYQTLKIAKKLFKVVNADDTCCSDCPYKKLGKMERMYLHRILKEEQRWYGRGNGQYIDFIKVFQGQITTCQDEESDAGVNITEDEFVNAVLIATQQYMIGITQKMSEEIKREYEKDAAAAGAP